MKNNKQDSKYFYIIVFLTLFIISFISWELFFNSYKSSIDLNSDIEEIPKLNFIFLESSEFAEMQPFNKKDEPLIKWKETVNKNPFLKTVFPTDEKAKKWWPVFTIKLNYTGKEFIGMSPDIISGIKNPELLLFKNRIYNIYVANLNDESCNLKFNGRGNNFYTTEIENSKEFIIRGVENMDQYECNDISGKIEVVEFSDNQEKSGKNKIYSILEITQKELNSLADKIGYLNLPSEEEENVKITKDKLQKELNSLRKNYDLQNISQEEVNRKAADIRKRIGSIFSSKEQDIEI